MEIFRPRGEVIETIHVEDALRPSAEQWVSRDMLELLVEIHAEYLKARGDVWTTMLPFVEALKKIVAEDPTQSSDSFIQSKLKEFDRQLKEAETIHKELVCVPSDRPVESEEKMDQQIEGEDSDEDEDNEDITEADREIRNANREKRDLQRIYKDLCYSEGYAQLIQKRLDGLEQYIKLFQSEGVVPAAVREKQQELKRKKLEIRLFQLGRHKRTLIKYGAGPAFIEEIDHDIAEIEKQLGMSDEEE